MSIRRAVFSIILIIIYNIDNIIFDNIIILHAIGFKFGKYIQTNRVRVNKKRLKSLLLSSSSFENFERLNQNFKMASQ